MNFYNYKKSEIFPCCTSELVQLQKIRDFSILYFWTCTTTKNPRFLHLVSWDWCVHHNWNELRNLVWSRLRRDHNNRGKIGIFVYLPPKMTSITPPYLLISNFEWSNEGRRPEFCAVEASEASKTAQRNEYNENRHSFFRPQILYIRPYPKMGILSLNLNCIIKRPLETFLGHKSCM